MFEQIDKVWKKVRAALLLFAVAALLAQALVPGMAEEEPDVPEWINEINPADYMLLDSDLPSDLKVAGDINVEARASEMAVVRDGRTEVERVAVVEMHESICQPDPEGVYDCIGGNYLVDVYVYETADLARAVWENTIVEEYGELPPPEGFEYVSNVIDPLDSRFGGEGRCVGPYIFYKNLVCTIFGGWDETDRKIGSLWLDKVSKTEAPKTADLKLETASLWMGYPNQIVRDMGNYKKILEEAADQQPIQALVFNVGDDTAENVHLQFYVQMPGEAEYQPLGDLISLGEIPAHDSRAATTFWDLKGENVEGASILAQAYIPGVVDINPDDNAVGIQVNVYYAHNGDHAYSWRDDAYSFENYGFDEAETERLAEGIIATAVGNMKADPSQKDLWIRLFFPQTYSRLWDYMNASFSAGAGGHCYGMAATSALYFMDPSLAPVGKKTYEMNLDEASQNIAIYHRAQMIPLVRWLVDESLKGPYFGRSWGQDKTYQAIKTSLKEERKPLIISFRGAVNNSTRGHAVLAYKLVEVEAKDRDEKEIYIYDSNFPYGEVSSSAEDQPMPVINLYPDGSLWWWTRSYMGYDSWRNPNLIAAHPVLRTIPLEDANALLPELKKMVKGWIETLKKDDKFAVDLRCPADALFTDSSGRRVGTIDGRVVNEIPGAEVVSSGEVEIYILPTDLEYNLEIVGTGSGEVGFDVIRPEGESLAKVVSFTNVSIGAGEKLTTEITTGGEIEHLKSGTSTIEPSLSGILDLGAESEGDETAAGDEVKDEAEVDLTAKQELIFERNTLGGVENDPVSSTSFTIDREWMVTEIKTYHWNYGQGKAPGMIGLQDESGEVLGMWPASGEPGSGGVPDAYWAARPNLTLQPGEYTILDSDPATWSHNWETAGEGIAWVYGIPSEVYGGEVDSESSAAGDETDLGFPEYGEILIDAPPGGWEGVNTGEAI